MKCGAEGGEGGVKREMVTLFWEETGELLAAPVPLYGNDISGAGTRDVRRIIQRIGNSTIRAK